MPFDTSLVPRVRRTPTTLLESGRLRVVAGVCGGGTGGHEVDRGAVLMLVVWTRAAFAAQRIYNTFHSCRTLSRMGRATTYGVATFLFKKGTAMVVTTDVYARGLFT